MRIVSMTSYYDSLIKDPSYRPLTGIPEAQDCSAAQGSILSRRSPRLLSVELGANGTGKNPLSKLLQNLIKKNLLKCPHALSLISLLMLKSQ